MGFWVRFGKDGKPKGYLNGHKKRAKRQVSKARRRWARRADTSHGR